MNDEQLLRYSRQIMLPEIDIQGQEKLLAARVLIVGLGGLGSPAAFYLAAAGIGTLILADDDRVDLSNLQRQILHQEKAVGEFKTESAATTIHDLNSEIQLQLITLRLEGSALENAVAAADLVVDGSDNFATRYALNKACCNSQTPLVSGAAIRMEGQVSVFDSGQELSPCYCCLYPPLTPDGDGSEMLNCAENGVASPLVGIIGSIQAMEAMKIIIGSADTLVGRVLYLDAARMDFRSLKLSKDPHCPVCASI